MNMQSFFRFIPQALRRLTPDWCVQIYHFFFAVLALVLYRHPSRVLRVIGVTGTKGKTSTALFLHAALTAAGEKTGLLSTVAVHIGEEVYPNTLHLTTPGRGYVQKKLREMVDAGCSFAVLEISSEGIRQFRDLGVWYDSVVFTNLSPEHLVTHKTFERYRAEKGKLFHRHATQRVKYIDGVAVPRFSVLSADSPHTPYFEEKSRSPHSEIVTVGISDTADLQATDLQSTTSPTTFRFMEHSYTLPFVGALTVQNALPALFLSKQYTSVADAALVGAFSSITLPGRMEPIDEGQDFRVFCDYAHEPLSIQSVSQAIREEGRVLLLVGGVGGGRWRYNAEEIGERAACFADVVVVTDVDPFFDDPVEIMRAVVQGAKQHAATTEIYEELDRKDAIALILSKASRGDTVVITGKGAELTMEVQGVSVPWDERAIIREALRDLLS